MIYTLDQNRVKTVGDNSYIAPNATVLGQVELGEDVSVWFGAVIRGDVEKIIIGKGSNIQDLSVLHVDLEVQLLVKMSQWAIKSCFMVEIIGNNSLIGINSVILNNVEIGNNCLIGKYSTHRRNKNSRQLTCYGISRKVKKEVDENLKIILKGSAEHYVENGKDLSQV